MQSSKLSLLTKHTHLIILTFCMLMGVGCRGDGLVDTLNKLSSGEYELVRKDELTRLREDAALGKSVGRYQQYSRGARTFRLDTATGETCILLATEEDWKQPEVAAIACRPQINWIVESPGTATGTNVR